MTSPSRPELFPIAIGNEEETMLMIGSDEAKLGYGWHFVAEFDSLIPKQLKTVLDKDDRVFLQNGGLIYDGGNNDMGSDDMTGSDNLERVTPECASPAEVATYIQSNEQLLVDMLGTLAVRRMAADIPQVARVQRRVVDSYGNTRGCHDNLEGRNPNWLELLEQNKLAQGVLLAHLATRSFMTGAGYVNGNGIYYGQKVQHIDAIDAYGYVNSAYRNASDSEAGPRFEIRCNDINISPWAINVRVGSSALMFAMLQTKLAKKMANYIPEASGENARLENFRRFNKAQMNNDGQLQFTTDNVRAIDFQERSLELMDRSLGNYIDIPENYRTLINEMRYYCQDFRKVMHGEAELSTLADRSDVGAKFSIISSSIQKDRDMGLERTPGDIKSQADDMRYDNITISAGSNGKPRTKYGYGYRLRDKKGSFRLTPKPREVERAYYYPPKATRANIRGTLIRQDQVSDCNWGAVTLKHIDQTIRLSEVMLTDPTLTAQPATGKHS